jgi:predicted O-methyltransferase YrrM
MVKEKAARILRYVIHPHLIKERAEEKNSLKHMIRLSEYSQFSKTLAEFIQSIAQRDIVTVDKIAANMRNSEYYLYLENCNSYSLGNSCGPMNGDSGILLYTIVKLMKPELMVETGVANGFSSAFILKAMNENQKGKLFSIDIPQLKGVTVPEGKTLGWVIPDELKKRWVLRIGKSVKILPKLLEDLGEIDIFLHDSRHEYETMIFEYETAWPFLKQGGILLSDDVKANDAFLDFVNLVNTKPSLFNGIGGTSKMVVKKKAK